VVERDPAHPHLEEIRARALPIVVADATREETLRNAGVDVARAVVCATDDDMRNVSIALAARAIAPGVHAVLRIYERPFARRIEERFGFRSALSSSELAAPAFVAAALDDPG
jgi:voltage-gated potassium channel Kch